MKTALNVGFGGRKVEIEGYDTIVNLDIRNNVGADVVCDGKKLPYPPESVDLIFSSHFLEHIARLELYELMQNWRSVLKPKGKLLIIVPDIEVACIEVLSGMTNPATFDILWGAQNYPENFHKSGFNKNGLIAFLKKYGFEIKKIACINREIHCEAVKSDDFYDG